MNVRVRLPREQAVASPEGRRCAECGDLIDPQDWCPGCSRGVACQRPHRHLRKRADAAYCDAACRARRRTTYVRDCAPRAREANI